MAGGLVFPYIKPTRENMFFSANYGWSGLAVFTHAPGKTCPVARDKKGILFWLVDFKGEPFAKLLRYCGVAGTGWGWVCNEVCNGYVTTSVTRQSKALDCSYSTQAKLRQKEGSHVPGPVCSEVCNEGVCSKGVCSEGV